MSYNISAYVERKGGDGKWELVTERPVSSNLKYVFEDYRNFRQLNWEDVSDGLQKKYAKEDDGTCFANFYVATLDELEEKVSADARTAYTRMNMVVRALGCSRIYNDDGEEMDSGGDDGKLTIPISKSLVEDIQLEYATIRNVGQREAFDLIVSEVMTDYNAAYRVVFTLI